MEGTIAIVVLAAAVAGAFWSRSRAPAVAIGLIGAIVGGLAAFEFDRHLDAHPVAADVLTFATFGRVGFGLLGLLAAPRGPSRLLRRAAAALLILSPVAAAALAVGLLGAPLGGWLGWIVGLVFVDAGVLAIVLLVSAWLVKEA